MKATLWFAVRTQKKKSEFRKRYSRLQDVPINMVFFIFYNYVYKLSVSQHSYLEFKSLTKKEKTQDKVKDEFD